MSIRYLSGINVDANTLFVDSANNRVGIGTGSPAYALDINGSVRTKLGGFFYAENPGGGRLGYFGTNSSGTILSSHNGSNEPLLLQAPQAGAYINFTIGSNEVMRIVGSNVGIGTTAPAKKLHVYSGASSSTAAANAIAIFEGGGNGVIQVNGPDASSMGLFFGRNGAAYYSGIERDGTNLYLKNNSSVAVSVNSSGQVGVGSTSVYHSSKLSVAGKVHFQTSSNTDIGGAIYSTWTQSANGSDYYAGDLRFQIFNASSGTYGLREAMMIDGKGFVGIGTTAPTSIFHISTTGANSYSGTITKGSNMKGIVNTLSNNADDMVGIYFATGSAAGTHWSGITGSRSQNAVDWSTQLNFYTHDENTSNLNDATQKMVIKGSGNVGIGTTAPESTSRLHIVNTSAAAKITLETSDSYDSLFNFSAATNEYSIGFKKSDNTFRIANANTLDSNVHFVIASGGNVGIGTTGPFYKQHTVISGATGDIAGFSLTGNVNNPTLLIKADATNQVITFRAGSNTATYPAIAFDTGTGGEKMRITSAGNVGIGTTAPVSTNLVGSLTIYKSYNGDTASVPSVTAQNYYENQSGLYIFGRNTGITLVGADSEGSSIVFANSHNNVYAQIGTLTGTTSDGGDMYFATGDNVEKMRIKTGGNVLIGTTTDAGYKLDVNGTFRSQGVVNIQNGYYENVTLNVGAGTTKYLYVDIQNSYGNVEVLVAGYGSAGSGSCLISWIDGGHGGGTPYHRLIQLARQTQGNPVLGNVIQTGAGGAISIQNTGGQVISLFITVKSYGSNSVAANAYLSDTAPTGNNASILNIDDINSRVGINTTNPANQLQIGSVGSTGYSGNHLAIGDGTSVFAVYMASNLTNLYTNKAFSFQASGAGSTGNVLINTTTDNGDKLQVSGNATINGNLYLRGGSRSIVGDGGDLLIDTDNVAGRDILLQTQSGQNVGINTTTPSTKLEIAGSAAGDFAALSLTNTNQSGTSDGASLNFRLGRTVDGFLRTIPAIKVFKEQQWTATPSTVDAAISFTTVMDEVLYERMRINAAGNVGIGTTNPGAKLEVIDEIRVTSDGSYSSVTTRQSGATGGGGFLAFQNAVANAYFGVAGWYLGNTDQGIIIGTDSSARPIRFYTNFEQMRITGGGNVLIGTTTDSGYKLDVFGKTRIYTGAASGATSPDADTALLIDSAGNQYIELRTSAASSGIMQGILFTDNGDNAFIGYKEYTGKTAGTYGEAIHLAYKDFSSSDPNNGIYFGTSATPSDGVSNVQMFIKGNGNVGIGTTTPLQKLHVVGAVVGGNTGTTGVPNPVGITTQLAFEARSTQAGNEPSIAFHKESVYTMYLQGQSSQRGLRLYGPSSETAPSLFVDGNVGIGTTAPSNKLTVTTATNAVDVLRLNNTGGDSGSVQGVTHLAINHFNSGTNPSTRITAYQDSTSGWPGGMYFSTRSLNTDSAPVERMRITSAGNVGIGTTSPQYLLDVNGDAQINASGTGPAYAYQPDGGFGVDSLLTSSVENVALGKPDVWLRIHVDGVAFVFPGYQEP